jgi:hypothetical protein
LSDPLAWGANFFKTKRHKEHEEEMSKALFTNAGMTAAEARALVLRMTAAKVIAPGPVVDSEELCREKTRERQRNLMRVKRARRRGESAGLG